ncbi:MAG: aspartate-semialdehyde dehydrogenase [Phycisphaerae bacterium]
MRSFKRIAIVGATGAVGREFGALLSEEPLASAFGNGEFVLLASSRSAEKAITWANRQRTIQALTPESFNGVDLALFSAGASISREFAPIAVRAGALVIDNSSAFRMQPEVPLVVPEINPRAAEAHRGIIANPNCSTIIVALALWPLHQVSRIRRVVVATYQAVSGAGARAMDELEHQTRDVLAGKPPRPEIFHEPCAFNVFSHNSAIGEDGYNVEESKMIHETRKIFGDESIRVAPTCVRVPVMRAHTAALSMEFDQPMFEADARRILERAPGLRVIDDRAANRFPTPLQAAGRNEVLVGRIRQDPSIPERRGLQLLVSGDQLRKGAALNALQIAELLHTR